jgi:hypothetical protein
MVIAWTAALASALALVLWGAAQASAGGPTSVLVVSPESKESSSLYFSDKKYDRLAQLLGEPGAARKQLPPGLGVGAGRQLNVTWLLHDIQPWRVDRVYPDTPGSKDVWIHTSTDMKSLNGVWHMARRPVELRALLHRLGVMGKRAVGGASPIFPAPEHSARGAAPKHDPASPGRTAAGPGSAPGSAGWWWVVPGALAGAALALLIRPLITELPQRVAALRRQRRDPDPRQELRDVEAP